MAEPGHVAALADELRGRPIDLLLNNAGVYGPPKMFLGEIDYAAWAEVFAVNVLGPTRMIEAFLDSVAQSEQKRIVCLSSLMGSIAQHLRPPLPLPQHQGRPEHGGQEPGRRSAQPRRDGCGMHRADSHTDMGGADADIAPEESMHSMVPHHRGAGRVADSGKFLSYDGSELPW